MGFSLQEGNGFWPETTEPPSHYRLASPLPIHSSDRDLGWKGVVQTPFPSGQTAQTGSHPLCVFLGNKPEWGREKLQWGPMSPFFPASLLFAEIPLAVGSLLQLNLLNE